MITIEEAKELGFYEANPYSDIGQDEPDLKLDIDTSHYILCYSDGGFWLYNRCCDWSNGLNLSHLNAEQVKQLITLLKP